LELFSYFVLLKVEPERMPFSETVRISTSFVMDVARRSANRRMQPEGQGRLEDNLARGDGHNKLMAGM